MAEFASRGVGAAGLTTGIIGTSLGALNSGILGNLFGGGNCNGGGGHNAPVNRYEMELQQKIAALESGIALRDANIFTDSKIATAYTELSKIIAEDRAANNARFDALNAKLCDQAVFNATATATMNCMGGQIAQLFGLTRLGIPNSSLCPGWGDVTVTPATATGA